VTGAAQGGVVGVETAVPAATPSNLLLLKVLSLLQGSDPVLAQAIASSREAIWGLLADPVKVATL
jgi:hypothetical protein